jgi:hypothetical protein
MSLRKETLKVGVRPLLTGVAVAAALVAVVLMGNVDSARAATTFNPTLAVTVENPTAGASSNFQASLDIPNGDVNFAAFIAFIPQQWGVVMGDHIPVGATVGQLDAQSVLGLANGACNQQLPVHFDMQNGSLNMDDTVSFEDKDDNNTADYADDSDGNGFFDAVDKYPEWLKRIFTDTGESDGTPIQPIRRSIGVTPVAGVPVILQFLIFPPGTQIDPAIPHDETLGFPSVTVLQNIGDDSAVPAPSIINDFCTPLATINVSNGVDDKGNKLFVNPPDGVYKFNTFALGQRDADGDSYENSLDTCALKPNVGNPRITGDGDVDSDGLDQACDPNSSPTDGTNSDQDLDGYQNRQDNCPLDVNGEEQGGNQKDTDLDQIGDACDPDPAKANGEYSVATPNSDVTIGAGGAGGFAQCEADGCYSKTGPTLNPGSGGGSSTAKPSSGSSSPTNKPGATVTPAPKSDDSSNTGTIIAIIAGVAAAVVIVGGGAALLMRRRGGA